MEPTSHAASRACSDSQCHSEPDGITTRGRGWPLARHETYRKANATQTASLSTGTFARTPISVFIIAFNEAHRIGKTIDAIRDLTDDIVVVDSGSTDGTQTVAQKHGARVTHRSWLGYGHQKRYAESQCKHDWLFNLDADEVVTQELKSEISELFNGGNLPQPGAYVVRICDVMPGEEAPRVFAYAHRYVRLYHRTAGRYRASTVHDTVQVGRGFKVNKLGGRIYHHSAVTLSTQVSKFNNYSDALVADMQRRHVVRPAWRLFLEFPIAFFKAYIVRRYCLRGTYGHASAMSYAFFRYLRMAKHIEARRRHRAGHKGI